MMPSPFLQVDGSKSRSGYGMVGSIGRMSSFEVDLFEATVIGSAWKEK